MSRRSQPSRLQWPITPEQLERIDQMFQEIYDDTDNGSLDVSGDQISGTVPVSHGGTGITSYTIGDILYASGTSALSALADVATGNVLRSGGVGVAPAWGKVNLATDVTGVLPIIAGGTNIQLYAVGDLLYASATTVLASLAIGGNGTFLRVASLLPTWSTLTIPNTAAQGDVFYATSANVMGVLTKSATATRYIANTGTTNAPAWDQIDLSNGVKGVSQDKLTLSVTAEGIVAAGYGAVVPRKYTINSGIKLALGSAAIFRIL